MTSFLLLPTIASIQTKQPHLNLSYHYPTMIFVALFSYTFIQNPFQSLRPLTIKHDDTTLWPPDWLPTISVAISIQALNKKAPRIRKIFSWMFILHIWDLLINFYTYRVVYGQSLFWQIFTLFSASNKFKKLFFRISFTTFIVLLNTSSLNPITIQ